MKQYILYLNLPDSYCQIFLPTENNRKYELELSAQLPVPPCKLELELLDGHWWLLQNAQIRLSAEDGPASMQLSGQTPVYGLLGADRKNSRHGSGKPRPVNYNLKIQHPWADARRGRKSRAGRYPARQPVYQPYAFYPDKKPRRLGH